MEHVSTNRTYRLDRTAYERTTKRQLYRRFAFFGAAVVVFTAAMFGFMAHRDEGLLDTLPYSAPVIVLVLAIGTIVNIRKQLVKQKPSWDSYELFMGPSLLVRQIVNLPAIEIVRNDVTRIHHSAGSGITVATADRHRFIFVPEALVGFDEVKERLSDWQPIAKAKAGHWASSVALGGAILASFLGTLLLPDIRLAIAAGVAFYALLAWSARDVVRSRVMDKKAKRVALASFVWFSIAPTARLLMHFFAD